MDKCRVPAHSSLWGIGLLAAVLAVPASGQPAATSSAEAVEQYRVAEQYQKLGEYDLAAKEWAKLAETYASDPLAAVALHYAGVCQYQLAHYDEAARQFAAFVAKYPQHELTEASLTNLGLAHYNLGQKSEGEGAKAHFRQAVEALARLKMEFPGGKFAPQGDYYRAESLYALGQVREAEAAYRQWLVDHPDNGLANEVRLALGATQTELGEAEQAIATLQALVASKPDGVVAAEASLRLGDALVAAGKPAEAAPHFAAAAAATGFADADYALQQQGAALFAAGDYQGAAKVYASFGERFPQSKLLGASRVAAGKCYYQLQDYELAARWLGEAVAAMPNSTDALHWYARSLMKAGQPAQAIAALEKASASGEDPQLLLDRADALYELPERRGESMASYITAADKGSGELAAEALHLAAATALELGDSKQAVSLAERLLREQAESSYVADARQTLAEARMQLGDNAAAVKLYDELLQSAGNEQRASWSLRKAWAQSGAGDEAGVAATLKPVVDSLEGPQQQEAHYLLGRALLASGEAAQATAHLARASQVESANWKADALLQLARAQQLSGELPAALATLEALLQQQLPAPIAATATFRRGEVRQKSGDGAGARVDYTEVATNWPDHALAPYALYRSAMLAIDAKESANAVESLEKLLAQHPEHKLAADAQLALGIALVQAKNYSKAIETLERMAANNDYTAGDRVLYELAWAYRDGEQGDKATVTFARLAKEYPESPYSAEAHYRLGESQFNEKKWQEALASFEAATKIAGAEPPLREKGLHMAAWSQLKLGEPLKAAESFANQVKEYPQGSLAADGKWMQGEALFAAEKYAEALAAYDAARDGAPAAGDLAPLGYLHAGQAAGQLEQWQASADWLAAAREKFPDYAGKSHIVFEWGVAQWKLGKTDDARGAFTQVADNDASPLGARAQFMLGELQFAAKDYEAAVRSFFKVSSGYQYPDSPEGYHPWQAESLFEAARCLEQLKRTSAAKKLYSELVTRFPEQPKAELAQQRLAELERAGQ